LSLALRDFTISSYFTSLHDMPPARCDLRAAEFVASIGTIRDSNIVLMLWKLVNEAAPEDESVRYGLYKLVERLIAANHRGQVLLSGLGLVGPLFGRFYEEKEKGTLSDHERSVMQKLLRRLLEIGVTTTAEARIIFQSAVREDDTLDSDVLEIVRSAMKAKWPAHFSLENKAALTMVEDGLRGMPTNGFTFMVSNSPHNPYVVTKPTIDMAFGRKATYRECLYRLWLAAWLSLDHKPWLTSRRRSRTTKLSSQRTSSPYESKLAQVTLGTLILYTLPPPKL
jgi:hypothetical protein